MLAPHLGERSQLEREQVGLARVAEAAAIADHRVRLDRLVRLAAREPRNSFDAEVHRAVDRPGRGPNARGERREPVGHASHELVASPLREELARVGAAERLERS